MKLKAPDGTTVLYDRTGGKHDVDNAGMITVRDDIGLAVIEDMVSAGCVPQEEPVVVDESSTPVDPKGE